jgi:diaminopimelate decarboxylase
MSDTVRDVVSRLFDSAAGELHIGGVPVTHLADRFGTPLYVYDGAVIDRAVTLLRETYPSQFDLYYSIKANPTRAILRRFLDRGFGLEVASGGEFRLALGAGCDPSRVVFAGPGKSEAEIELVLRQGIGEIHIESLLEGARVCEIAGRLGVSARVALRVNPGAESQGGAMRMGGKPTPFGIDEELLEDALARLSRESALEIRGIHLFAGTQILDHRILESQYRRGLDIGHRAAAQLGRPLSTLDFGGGLGIPYFAGEAPLDMKAWGKSLRSLIGETRGSPSYSDTRFLVEPGRFLVGEAGVYVTRVSDVKTSRGKTFLVLDGGMNHHLAASGNLGQVLKRNFPAAILNRLGEPSAATADLVGPLCTPLDVIARDVPVPEARAGDLVGVFQSGAYARSASPLGFLSHPAPPEVLVEGHEATLIRRRGEPEDQTRDLV